MIPNITRGDRFGGLMSYLAGEGRSNEHTNPHVVAGEADIFAFYGGLSLDNDIALSIAYDLDEARRITGTEITSLKRREGSGGVAVAERAPSHVWHCSLSLRAEEGELSDQRWQEIAENFVREMGFTEHDGKAPCKWVAVRHGLSTNGNDHIHIAVSLVRQDGTKASVHHDFSKAQRVARELEVKYGLEVTGDRANDRGTRGVTPAAAASAERRGEAEPDATRLARTVRAAAAAASTEGEFVRRCRRAGVAIRPRFAKGRTDVVDGYSVALRSKPGEPTIWHGGGKLGRDLTLTRLRNDWDNSVEASIESVEEWRAAHKGQRVVHAGPEVEERDPDLWVKYQDEISKLSHTLERTPITDRQSWAHAARQTAGVLAAWSAQTEATPGPLAALSDELARSAQTRARTYVPPASPMPSLRRTVLLVSSMTQTKSDVARALMLLEAMARLAQSVHRMLEAEGAARRAQQMADTVRQQLMAVRPDRLTVDVATQTAPETAVTESAAAALDARITPEQAAGGAELAPPAPRAEQPDDRHTDLER